MALTKFQRALCHVLATSRNGQASYVAGAVALNALADAPRISRDIDLFHDSQEALQYAWNADRATLQHHGYSIEIVRERPAYIEAVVGQRSERVLVQWLQDSAFRFFPLQAHPDFGWTLHPLDLATNKLLALAGRVEVRDWIDMITCHQMMQPLGLLAFAACGKDPGYNPLMLLDEASRASRYSRAEVEMLDWDGAVPDAEKLSRTWKTALREAEEMVTMLPSENLGDCILDRAGAVFRGSVSALRAALDADEIVFHAGAVRGVWPLLRF